LGGGGGVVIFLSLIFSLLFSKNSLFLPPLLKNKGDDPSIITKYYKGEKEGK